jgi:hypothetical protein
MELSDKQKDKFKEYVQRWLKVALCTDPIDKDAAIDAVCRDYVICGLEPPKRFAIFSSPYSAAFATAILKDHWKRQSKEWQRWINDGVEIITQAELPAFLETNMTDDLKSCARSCVSEMMYGAHDASWLAMYEFSLYELGAEECRRMIPLMDLAKACGWWAPYDEVAILQDRPAEIHYDEQYRLHNLAGPALSYRDGWKLYKVHAVDVPEWIIKRPENITVNAIDNEFNAEVRRVMVEKFGHDRYLIEGKAELVHEDDFGKLWVKPQADDESIMMVEVINGTPEPDGTFRNFFKRVPPDMRTARQAVAWTYELDENDYLPTTRT